MQPVLLRVMIGLMCKLVLAAVALDRAYEVEGERQSNVEEVYRVNHINQTFDFVCPSTLVMTISAWFKSNQSSNA